LSSSSRNVPAKERALVLQGGGALGAYEAGAYKGLYEWLSKKDKSEGKERSITFDIITIDQVMASGCFAVNFDYALLEVESYFPPNPNNNNLRTTSDNQDGGSNDSTSTSSSRYRDYGRQYRKEIRHFWDGGLLTNTPLTQLVILHRDYWYKIRGLKDKVPTLSVGVINVHPTRQTEIPTDHDGVVDRRNDITFSDMSHRDEEVLLLVSDYIDLVRDLIRIAKEAGAKDKVITDLLNQRTKYHGLSSAPRLNKEIIEGRFDIDHIIRIERKNDEHTISDKTFDFSSGTITHLMKNGYEDTLNFIHSKGS
jgi:NTE family protein